MQNTSSTAVTEIATNGDLSSGTLGTSGTTTWYILTGTNITHTGTVTVSGDVHLILADSASLTVTGSASSAGIDVSGSNSLTIYAQSTGNTMGALTATGGGAGIGGGQSGSGGSVTINGGSVKADIQAAPTNGTVGGNAPVYLTTVTLEGVSAKTAVTALTAALSYPYGIKDMTIDGSGKLYLYLPDDTETTVALTGTGQYTGSIQTSASSISTGTLHLNSAAPAVASILPPGTGAATSGNIVITFNKIMSNAAVGTVSLDGGATSLTGGSWNTPKTVYTGPYSGLASGTAYTVTVSGFGDYSGNAMAEDAGHSFTTAAATVTAPTAVTDGITGRTDAGATLGGSVTATGGAAVTERGFVLGTAADPKIGGAGVIKIAAGSGTGRFSGGFSDVPEGAWYASAVGWAAETGLASGVGGGRFDPEGPVTREQLAVLLYRFAQYMGYDVSVGEETNILSYLDAFDISEYAYPALQWACGAGLLQGDGAGNLSPGAPVTRAEAAALLARFEKTVAGG